MKPTISVTLTSLPVNGNYSSTERTADDDVRLRRDAERAKLRRLQNQARHHAEAESRLADAMVKATARAAADAGPSVRMQPAATRSSVLPPTTDVADSGSLSLAQQEALDARIADRIGVDARHIVGDALDPVGSLLQRITLGRSRGLLQDCAPLLESIAEQLTHGGIPRLEQDGDQCELLECALDFLHGYADAAAGRMAGAERIGTLAEQVRQHLEALALGTASTSGAGTTAVQQLATRGEAKARTVPANKNRDRVDVTRKAGPKDSDDADAMEAQEAAAGMALVTGSVANPDRVANVPESSLDKDQRKRREETLPLVTLRSI